MPAYGALAVQSAPSCEPPLRPRQPVLRADTRRPLKAHGLIASRGKKGDCYDHATIESGNRSLKVEATHKERFPTRQDTKKQVFEYIEIYYNRKRLHPGLGYVSPGTFEQWHVA